MAPARIQVTATMLQPTLLERNPAAIPDNPAPKYIEKSRNPAMEEVALYFNGITEVMIEVAP